MPRKKGNKDSAELKEARRLRREMVDLSGDDDWMKVPPEMLVPYDSAEEIMEQSLEPSHFIDTDDTDTWTDNPTRASYLVLTLNEAGKILRMREYDGYKAARAAFNILVENGVRGRYYAIVDESGDVKIAGRKE